MKKEFQINMGAVDSFLRIFVGVWLMASALIGWIGYWGLAGGVLVITGMARYCPAYSVCGLNSNRSNAE